MSHIKKYKIFPDKWEKSWSERQLSDARLQLKSYVTTKDTELGIKEVSNFLKDFSFSFCGTYFLGPSFPEREDRK